MGENAFRAESIKLGPQPPQRISGGPPRAQKALIEVTSDEMRQRKESEKGTKMERASDLQGRLTVQKVKLKERIEKLTKLDERANKLEKKIESKAAELKKAKAFIRDNAYVPGSFDDQIKSIEEDIKVKDAAIKSLGQQGGKDAEAKIAKVMEAKGKLEERLAFPKKKKEDAEKELAEARGKKMSLEGDVGKMQAELVEIEKQIEATYDEAHKLRGGVKVTAEQLQTTEKDLADIDALLGWIESERLVRIQKMAKVAEESRGD